MPSARQEYVGSTNGLKEQKKKKKQSQVGRKRVVDLGRVRQEVGMIKTYCSKSPKN